MSSFVSDTSSLCSSSMLYAKRACMHMYIHMFVTSKGEYVALNKVPPYIQYLSTTCVNNSNVNNPSRKRLHIKQKATNCAEDACDSRQVSFVSMRRLHVNTRAIVKIGGCLNIPAYDSLYDRYIRTSRIIAL